jgi:acetyltransferase
MLGLGIKEKNHLADFLTTCHNAGKTELNEYEAKNFFKIAGLPVIGEHFLEVDQAIPPINPDDYPLVLKGISRSITHKTEHGLVHLDLHDEIAVLNAKQNMIERMERTGRDKELEGFLLSPMQKISHQLVVGTTRDPQFGSVIMVGMGGIYVEVLKDVVFRCGKVSREEALDMLSELKCAPILHGTRGEHGIDLNEMSCVIEKISLLSNELEEIESMEVNPIAFTDTGFVILDALMKLKRNA